MDNSEDFALRKVYIVSSTEISEVGLVGGHEQGSDFFLNFYMFTFTYLFGVKWKCMVV